MNPSAEMVWSIVILAALALLVVGVGALGRARRITYSLGAWTEDGSTPESWDAAHRTIGSAFMLAGIPPLVALVAVLLGSDSSAGPIAGTGAIAMLPVVAIGIARGLGRIEPRMG